MNIDSKLKQALALQEQGDLPQAETAFRGILRESPNDFAALYSLGAIAMNSGDPARALAYFDRAAAAIPTFALSWFNRGLALETLQRPAEALASYQRALEADPECSQARAGRDALAARMASRSAAADPAEKKALEARRIEALQLMAEDRLADADALFQQILAANPGEFVSLYSMAVIASRNNDLPAALDFADQVTALNPGYAPAWYNRGTILYSMKRNVEALANFDHALSLEPGYLEALVNRGAVLQELNRHAEALENFNRLLEIDPVNTKALVNKGILLTQFQRWDEAIVEFDKALKIDPAYDYLPGQLCFAHLHVCSWGELDRLSPLIDQGIRGGKRVCNSLALMAISNLAQVHLLGAQIYSSHMCAPAAEKIWQGEHYGHDKIRIAYISPDLRQHPVGHLMAGIFENHDKDKFEIISISLGNDDQSALRQRFIDASDRFIDARQMNSRDIALLIRSQEIDIAVDLAGYTADSRSAVFAYRPAPVQVNYLGYAGTMGAEYMDYLLADQYVVPEQDRGNFSEKIVYLPDTYLPTDGSLQLSPRMPTREEYGLPATGFIFCSFNHDYKINPPMFEVWMRLLHRVPGSVLWLMKLNSSAEANLVREARARGVDPARMIFATRVPSVGDHLARYQLAGLFLDTTPYNAHTTASDALRAGLPVLTVQGTAFPGRVAGSLLHAIGLPELIAPTLEAYEELAVRIASDAAELDDLKGRLRANRESHPLFDTKRFCRNLEQAYTGMQERRQAGKGPEHFSLVAQPPERSPHPGRAAGGPRQEGGPGVAILIPVYQEKLNEQEQFSVDFLLRNVTRRKLYFIAPEGLDRTYYAASYPGIEFRTYPDRYFASITGYNHLLLDADFYRGFADYEYLLIHQTDALMFRDNLDDWMERGFDYIGAPWPNGLAVNMKLGKFNTAQGINLRAYVGNGGFSLRSVRSTINLLVEFEEIREHWVKTGGSEDLFFAFMGMVSERFTIPNQMIASKFSLELEAEHYFQINDEELPTGCHAWMKHEPEFWEKVVAGRS